MQRFSHFCHVRYPFPCCSGRRMLPDCAVPATAEGFLATSLPRRSKREWSALYGRHQRQREQLAKDCRGALGRFRLWRELGGGVREIGGAIRGRTEVLGRFRAELEDRLRWERVSLGKAHSEAVRGIESKAGEFYRAGLEGSEKRAREAARSSPATPGRRCGCTAPCCRGGLATPAWGAWSQRFLNGSLPAPGAPPGGRKDSVGTRVNRTSAAEKITSETAGATAKIQNLMRFPPCQAPGPDAAGPRWGRTLCRSVSRVCRSS